MKPIEKIVLSIAIKKIEDIMHNRLQPVNDKRAEHEFPFIRIELEDVLKDLWAIQDNSIIAER